MKLHRFLGRKGRTTIPLPIREHLELSSGDLLSFTLEDDAVVIRREKVCDKCIQDNVEDLEDFFDVLNLEQQQKLVSYLAGKIMRRKGGVSHGRH